VTWLVPIGALLTLGLAAPVLFAIAGIQTRQRSWQRAAAFYAVAIWGGVVLLGASEGDSAPGIIGFLAWLIGWISATIHAFLIRGEYQHRLAGAQNPLEAARSAVEARKEAHRLVREEPDVARELGVGRPDVEGARTMGVIDVNQVPAPVLATLPGIDNHLAAEIVRAREDIDGFKSLEDMGGVMDLDGNTVEDIRPYVVFVPR
jgi:DNA uptake protein ComE-like DNA-binding protein